jgi:hypothetical protein
VDINGMYPACCMKALAIGNYRWLDRKELDELDITNLPEGKGMLIECDLLYPAHLHNRDVDLPLAPEKRQINFNELSEHHQIGYRGINGKISSPFLNDRLLLTLHNKHNYVTMVENLIYYVNKGLRLSKVHKALEYSQAPWLKEFVEYCFILRRDALSPGEVIGSNFIKALLFHIYGCFLMSNKNYVIIEPCFSKHDCMY